MKRPEIGGLVVPDAARVGRVALGVAPVVGGALIVTGLDHRLEADLVEASPAWLTGLTTRF